MKLQTTAILFLMLAATACSERAARGQAGIMPPPSPATMNEPQASPAPMSAPYDLQFLDTMSAHHRQGVAMAEIALGKAQHAELKTMARQMTEEQRGEIEQMTNWRRQCFANEPLAINHQMAGMSGMDEMTGGGTGETATQRDRPGHKMRDRLETAAAGDFDAIFLQMMLPHHQSAVTMAQDALGKAQHAEVKELARRIAESQQREIEQMNGWRTTWTKRGGG